MAEINKDNVSIPESITIGDTVYNVKDTPALQQLIQAVSKVEKTKLYSRYDDLKKQVDNLQNVKVEPSDTASLLDSLKGVVLTKEDLQEYLPKAITEVVQPLLQATARQNKESLDAYRDKLIKDNLATCIPDLVIGNTKEELDAALAKSIELRAKYPSPSSQGVVTNAQKGEPINTKASSAALTMKAVNPQNDVLAAPSIAMRQSPDMGEPTNIKRMSLDEFSKKRNELQRQLASIYGGGANTSDKL